MGTESYFKFSLKLMSSNEFAWIQQRCQPAGKQSLEELCELYLNQEEYDRWPSFTYRYETPSTVIFHDVKASCPSNLAKLLYGFLRKFRTRGTCYTFEWACLEIQNPFHTENKGGGGGGGAFFITYEGIKTISTLSWVYEQKIKWEKKRH